MGGDKISIGFSVINGVITPKLFCKWVTRAGYKLTTARLGARFVCFNAFIHQNRPKQTWIVNTWKTRSPKLTTSLAYIISPPWKRWPKPWKPQNFREAGWPSSKSIKISGFFAYVLGSGLIIGPLKHPMKDEGYNSHVGSTGRLYIYTHVYHKNQRNVGKYTIHGSYGIVATP